MIKLALITSLLVCQASRLRAADFQVLGREAEAMSEYAISIRRKIHQTPELRWKEDQTLKMIEAEVREAMKNNKNGPRATIEMRFTGGLVIDVQGEGASRLFRADVDALPLTEATAVPYKSKTAGVMHACGHDAHAAMLLATLKAIIEGRVHPKRSLRFVFQRAEENPIDESGGARLVREGILDGVDEVYGLHVSQSSPPGTLLSRSGPILANSDRFKVKITCSGGHVANPEKGINAIDIVSDIHVSMRGFDRRFLGALEPCALVPSVSNAGLAPNSMPAEAELWYSVRHYLSPERRDGFSAAIRKQVETVVSNYSGAKAEYEYMKGHPALINAPEVFERTSVLLKNAGLKVEEHRQDFAGDDLAYYLQKRPGAYWALGVHKDGGGGLHTPKFDMDENALKTGILFWMLLSIN